MYQQQTEHDIRVYPRMIQLVGYAILAPIVGYLAYVLYSYYAQTPLRLIDDIEGF